MEPEGNQVLYFGRVHLVRAATEVLSSKITDFETSKCQNRNCKSQIHFFNKDLRVFAISRHKKSLRMERESNQVLYFGRLPLVRAASAVLSSKNTEFETNKCSKVIRPLFSKDRHCFAISCHKKPSRMEPDSNHVLCFGMVHLIE